jgi:hypothetical protein
MDDGISSTTSAPYRLPVGTRVRISGGRLVPATADDH